MKYAALLRGIGPGNPDMRNDKLREVFEELGFQNVQSVISSGNIIFETDRNDIQQIEAELEKAWPEKLGFTSTTIVRSKKQLQELVILDPFQGMTHGPSSYLLVTLFKKATHMPFKLPYQPEGKTYKLLGATNTEVFTTTDNTVVKTTDLMTWLEKQFGKEITSRTWKTLGRILKKLDS